MSVMGHQLPRRSLAAVTGLHPIPAELSRGLGRRLRARKRPKCSAPKALLFDHFVGDGEQISRNRKPDGLCGFQFFFANSIRSEK